MVLVSSNPPTYEVRIAGAMPLSVLLQLDDVQVASQELRTVVSGRFEDQAALYGFLNRLRDLGLDVVEVRRVSTGPAGAAAGDEPTETEGD